MADFLNKVVARGEKLVTVFDIRVLTLPAISDVRQMADYCAENFPAYGHLEQALAVVIEDNLWSMGARWMINLVTTIQPPASPLLVCHSMDAAEGFFAERIEGSPKPKKSVTFQEVDDLWQLEVSPHSSGGGVTKRMLQTSKTASIAFFALHEDSADFCAESGLAMPAADASHVAPRRPSHFVLDELEADAMAFDESSIDKKDQRTADLAKISKIVAERNGQNGSWWSYLAPFLCMGQS